MNWLFSWRSWRSFGYYTSSFLCFPPSIRLPKKIRKLLPISFFSMLSLGESSQFWPSKRLVWSWAAPGKSSCAATATTSLPRLCCGTGSAWFGRRMRRRRRTWRMRFWRCCPCGDGLIDVDIPWCSHIYISSSMGNLYWSKNHFFHGTMEYLIFLYGQIMGKMKVKIRRFFCGIRRWEYRISCGKTNALNCKPTFFWDNILTTHLWFIPWVSHIRGISPSTIFFVGMGDIGSARIMEIGGWMGLRYIWVEHGGSTITVFQVHRSWTISWKTTASHRYIEKIDAWKSRKKHHL